MTKQIDIQELIPFMKDGWVAMNPSNSWFWFVRKPSIMKYAPNRWSMRKESPYNRLSLNTFNITPAEDWTKSLIKIKGEE